MARSYMVPILLAALVASAIAVPISAQAGTAAMVLAGGDDSYTPLGILEWAPPGEQAEGAIVTPRLSLGARWDQVDPVPTDRDGTLFEAGEVTDMLIRVGVDFHSRSSWAPWFVLAELEADVASGPVRSDPTLFGAGYPASGDVVQSLRKANATLSYKGFLMISAGLMTSHWGLGLLANDGDHGWEPGSADFTDPRGGDRVMRAMASVMAIPEMNLLVAGAYDQVVDDDAMLEGDEASQFVAAVILGFRQDTSAGIYVVSRRQESAGGAVTEVTVTDVTAQTSSKMDGIGLDMGAEVAMISGTTELGPSPEHPTHDVKSLGAALRFNLSLRRMGLAVDGIYASGDHNLDDRTQNAFKADVNFGEGLMLFGHVLAAQTARAPHMASDPDLVGTPMDDLERIPTHGAITNTISVFPRVWWRPMDGLEFYGGPLLAWAESKLTDPFNTRLAGGQPHNALNGTGGRYLGTEVDVGLRYQAIVHGTELTLGVEGALFMPGDAFANGDDDAMDSIVGLRALAQYRL